MPVTGDTNVDVQGTLDATEPDASVVSGVAPNITLLSGIVANANTDTYGTLSPTTPEDEVASGEAPNIKQLVGIVANAYVDTYGTLWNGYVVYAWVANYQNELVQGAIEFSFDNFESIASVSTVENKYDLYSCPPPEYILTGSNVSETLPDTFYFRFRPFLGVPVSDSAPAFYGELQATYTRLKVSTLTYDRKPAPYTDVELVGYDLRYFTDANGELELDCPSGSISLKSLMGSAEKTVTLEPFTVNEVEFVYAGIEVSINVAGSRVVGVEVRVDGDSVFTDRDGIARYYMAKVNTGYTLSLIHI